jgi:hypothetical protein
MKKNMQVPRGGHKHFGASKLSHAEVIKQARDALGRMRNPNLPKKKLQRTDEQRKAHTAKQAVFSRQTRQMKAGKHPADERILLFYTHWISANPRGGAVEFERACETATRLPAKIVNLRRLGLVDQGKISFNPLRVGEQGQTKQVNFNLDRVLGQQSKFFGQTPKDQAEAAFMTILEVLGAPSSKPAALVKITEIMNAFLVTQEQITPSARKDLSWFLGKINARLEPHEQITLQNGQVVFGKWN